MNSVTPLIRLMIEKNEMRYAQNRMKEVFVYECIVYAKKVLPQNSVVYLYRYNLKIGFIFMLFLSYGKYVERMFGSFCLLPVHDFISNLISYNNGFTIFIMFPSYVFRQYYIEIINSSLISSDIKFPLVMKLPNNDLK